MSKPQSLSIFEGEGGFAFLLISIHQVRKRKNDGSYFSDHGPAWLWRFLCVLAARTHGAHKSLEIPESTAKGIQEYQKIQGHHVGTLQYKNKEVECSHPAGQQLHLHQLRRTRSLRRCSQLEVFHEVLL
ncbi:hypothetical protein SADUNF_Sadunf03G0012000 [Salix dunnii]|uniref:Uncharacterized protein n=1 Tax=Salix dunnii TaxID=1413687 RepID=A0A835KFQ5_9ROSI|nr:hypothetical protein SADUNF_Sadunf03G0012000 [Salix dunnii]